MPKDIERIKKLAQNNLIEDAVELPANHKNKNALVSDIEELLQTYDDDANYAHFVVRVKRSEKPVFVKSDIDATNAVEVKANTNQGELFSINTLVNETLNLASEIGAERTKKETEEKAEYDPKYLFENAQLLEEHGDWELARNLYKTITKRGLMMAEALYGVARTFEKQNKADEAIVNYEEAIAYASEPELYQSLTALLIRNGRDKEAAEALLRALTIPGLNDNQKFEFHKSLGNCFSRMNDHKNAEKHYFNAYELNSDSDSLQVNVGSLALNKNDFVTAKKHFERALELNYKNEKAICGLGLVELNTGHADRAHDLFVEALNINPKDLGAIFNLVKCAYELKRFNSAERYLGQYIASIKDPNVNILYSYAGILYHQNEHQRALAQIDIILAAYPNHGGAKELKELIQKKMS